MSLRKAAIILARPAWFHGYPSFARPSSNRTMALRNPRSRLMISLSFPTGCRRTSPCRPTYRRRDIPSSPGEKDLPSPGGGCWRLPLVLVCAARRTYSAYVQHRRVSEGSQAIRGMGQNRPVSSMLQCSVSVVQRTRPAGHPCRPGPSLSGHSCRSLSS